MLTKLAKLTFSPETEAGAGATGGEAAAAPEGTENFLGGEAGEAGAEAGAGGGEGEPPASGEGGATEGGEGAGGEADSVPLTMQDFTLPEGTQLTEGAETDFLAIVNDPGLSKAEMVNKLLEMQGTAVTAAAQANTDAWLKLQKEWRDAIPSVLGMDAAGTERARADIKRGLTAVGATKETYDAFVLTGAGNNPHLVKLIHTLVQPFLEAAPPAGGAEHVKPDLATRLYPSMHKDT